MAMLKSDAPGEGVFDAKVDGVDEQVGDKKEEVGAAEAGQQMVENIPHWPGIVFANNSGGQKVFFSKSFRP